MGPVIECGPPPGLALRSAMISSIVIPGLILSCECIMVSIETMSPEFTLSLGGSFGSSQPHCTVSSVAASVWCLPPFCCAKTALLAASAKAAMNVAYVGERRCGMGILSVCGRFRILDPVHRDVNPGGGGGVLALGDAATGSGRAAPAGIQSRRDRPAGVAKGQ